MATFKITGTNPYEIEFDPTQGTDEMAHVWTVQKAGNSACLAITANAIPGSNKVGGVLPENLPIVLGKRSAPQKIKVTVDCGTCTCGGNFTVIIIARYFSQSGFSKVSTMPITTTTLSIACAGPNCTNPITIAFLSDPIQLDSETFSNLSPDALSQVAFKEVDLNLDLGLDVET